MKQTILFTTDSGNCYLYDNKNKMSMFIHPNLKRYNKDEVDCDGDEYRYYINKFAYLKQYGFFSDEGLAPFNAEIPNRLLKESLIDTPQLLIEVTDFCNLNCGYCALGDLYNGNDNRNEKNVDFDKSIKLFKYIYDLKVANNKNKLVISFYGGEPLLNFDYIKRFIEEVQEINIKNIDIKYNMTTNAILLNKYIDFLVKNEFNILVSLDGNCHNNSYRVFRKKSVASFNFVVNNLDKVKNKYPSFFEHNINFNAVLHDRNSVKEIYEFIYKRYHKFPQISELNVSNVAPQRRNEFDKIFNSIHKSETEYLKQCKHLLPHNKTIQYHELVNFLKYFTINSYVSNILLACQVEEKYFPACTCIPFSKRMFLTTNNLLLPCEKINHKYHLGKVSKTIDIDITHISEQYQKYFNKLKNTCKNCYIQRFCGVCMYHIKGFEDSESETVLCESYHDVEKFTSKLSRVFSYMETNPKDYIEILEDVVIVS